MNEHNENGFVPEENIPKENTEQFSAPQEEINTPQPAETESAAANNEKTPDFEIESIEEPQVKKSSFEINPPPAYNEPPRYTAPYTPRENKNAPEAPNGQPYRPAPGHNNMQGAAPVRPPVDPAVRRQGNNPPPTPPFNGQQQEQPRITEYRYTPPYAGIGANTPKNPGGNGATPPPPPPTPTQPPRTENNRKKKEKTVRTFPTVALVFILIGTVLLSFASGMLGSLLVVGGFKTGEIIESEAKDDGGKKDEGLVIQKPAADDKEENDSPSSGEAADLSDVSAFVSASVVEISTEFSKTYYGYYQYVQEGAGSGVIISEDGYLLTNAHVITDTSNGSLADTIKVRLTNGEEYTAKIIGSDSDSDIALLKINGSGFTAATIGNSDSIKVGEQILAVGNPLGELGGTVTAGIVSATNREISVENNIMTLIQIDAAINPGNSGGGLFNTKGELIGIVNAKTTDVTVEGLGFAIPINEAIRVAEELEEHGYVTGRTHIGISLTDVTDSYSAYYYFRSEATGVYIVNVQDGYNEKVLKYGDRITAIDGNEVNSTEDVKSIISKCEVGDVLVFTISREGKLKEVKVTCYEYVPESNVSFD